MVESFFSQNNELKELRSDGINVRFTDQEILEKQALKELESFAEDNNKNVNDLEDGEIVETISNFDHDSKLKETHLNIETYIKRQEDLKKRQEFQRSLNISVRSQGLAQKVSKKNNAQTKKKKCDGEKRELRIIDKKLTYENNSEEEKSGSEYIPSENELDSDYEECETDFTVQSGESSTSRKRKRKTENEEKVSDDGLIQCYQLRLDIYYKQLEKEISLEAINDIDDCSEFHLLQGGLKVPIKTWQNLYRYQQDGLKWLWNIHQKASGGLLGDEMGLGKTVQIIAFLNALEYSKILSCHGRFRGLGPSIIVCPATVIHQWVKHFHEWAPEFRVAVLHQSGNFQGNKSNLIKEINACKGIILTTYLGILKYKGNLLEYNWHYLILDEGHKIRNPTAKVSIAAKEIRTPHKILLTGSPMQNNLTELWNLFDFINPSMLGNLATFQEHFANPILHGGFSNSTPMQEATALSVATTLKNVISPYLLRRSKSEVQQDISLPQKSEQVLFCSLTNEQKDLYKGYLMSEHVNMILGKGTKNWFSENYTKSNILVAITTLRKICNHPDIYLSEAEEYRKDDESTPHEERFGYYKRSGKMVVVSALLKIWKKQGHRVLLFSQGRSMIYIFQDFLEQQGYKYLKMDGTTAISSRQPLIDKFNQDSTYDVFLLTTRVGGLGVNLTGANRVIIFDPDWNPATDIQARERAWRIGQEKQVTVYRLLSAGTIEEKMYQRQVWKQLLSNKVLIDPRTNRFFKNSDLQDLFSLQETTNSDPETTNIFRDSRVRMQKNIEQRRENKKKKLENIMTHNTNLPKVEFTEDKIEAMKHLAQQIAKSLSHNNEKSCPPKTPLQLELELERQEKLKEKQELKKLTGQELLLYNKEKYKRKRETINEIDGCETNVSFISALEYSEKTAKLHHDLVSGKKDPEVIVTTVSNMRENIVKNRNLKEIKDKNKKCKITEQKKCKQEKKHKSKKKNENDSVVDISGTLDGEKVEGLVKSEIKKIKKKKLKSEEAECQDDFILGKLFSKKGVSGALEHDSIIQSGSQGRNLKIHREASLRAEKSLEALRKSRLDNWRW